MRIPRKKLGNLDRKKVPNVPCYRGRRLIPIRIYNIKIFRSGNEIRPPFIPTLLSLILTSLSLPPDPSHDPLRFPPHPHREQFALPKTSARSYEEKLPFLSILPFPWIPLSPPPRPASSRCASFLPTVGKLALTRTTKECNQ